VRPLSGLAWGLETIVKSLLAVVRIFGGILLVFSVAMLAPLLVAWAGPDGALQAYAWAVAATVGCGLLLWFLTPRKDAELMPRDGLLLVSLVWTVIPLFACLPLLFYFQQAGRPISVTDAYFETVSGLTTGATVLTGLDALPPSINFWRCFLQWMGGMGILVLTVAILPMLGVGGSQLFRAEATGPMKDTKLTPRIAATAKGLWSVYALISLLCFLAYGLSGMGWMDALMHTFTTMSLGGMSSHDASFGHFKSPVLEWVCVLFMLVASCNFALYFVALKGRSPWHMPRETEFRATLITMVGASVLVALFLLWKDAYGDWGRAFRDSFFNVVSIASTTGYATTDYGKWPMFAPILMLLLSGVATSAGSTGAGIEMVRAVILVKQARGELQRVLHPRVVNPVILNRNPISVAIIHSVLAFMLLYGATVVVLTLLLMASDMDFVTALSGIIACINNMDPGLNEIGPAGNFAGLSDVQTGICTLAMILGRLEIVSLLLLLTPSFWRR
jgi:trk system potassium uptake protein TrkH